MNIRKILFVVVALTLLLGGSWILSLKFAAMKKEPPRRPSMDMMRFVKAEKVIYKDIMSKLIREGRVYSGGEVTLVSEASGKIEKGEVSLREGAAFKKGQLLAVIYKDEVELALKARKSQFLTTLTSILPDLRVDYPNAIQQYEDFFQAIDISKDLPALPENSNDKVKIFLASRNVLSEYYSILQDEKRLERHSLYAPFDGTFIQVNFEQGGYVNIGGQIAKMIRTDMMEIEVPVESDQSKWIKVGDKVNILFSGSDLTSSGKVVRKSNFINEDTQSRSVYVVVDEALEKEFLAGEYLSVEFPGQLIKDVMEVSRSAVFNSNEVFVVENDKLKKRKINILKYNQESLIFNGLIPGGKLVVEPLINVKENSPVGIVGESVPKRNKTGGKGKAGEGKKAA